MWNKKIRHENTEAIKELMFAFGNHFHLEYFKIALIKLDVNIMGAK